MKFSISHEQAQHMRLLLSKASALCPSIMVTSVDDVLRLQGMDSCQICLLDCQFRPEWFEGEVLFDGTVNHVATKVWASVLKIMDEDQMAAIHFDNGEMSIKLTGSDTSCNKEFTIPLLHLDNELINIDTVMTEESTAELCITSKKFSDLVAQFEMFDEVLAFELSEAGIELSASGELGSMSATLDLDGGHLLEFAVVEDVKVKQSFSHRFVKAMSSFASLAEDCELKFYEDRPLFVVYTMKDTDERETARLVIMLAPRVD